MRSAAAASSASESAVPSVPSITGTPRAPTCAFALTLSPITSIASIPGPMKTMPAAAQARANAAFSERNP